MWILGLKGLIDNNLEFTVWLYCDSVISFVCILYFLEWSRLCSNRVRWPLAPNFCSWATRKSYFFHTNHMLGNLDFTGSEHWAPFNFP